MARSTRKRVGQRKSFHKPKLNKTKSNKLKLGKGLKLDDKIKKLSFDINHDHATYKQQRADNNKDYRPTKIGKSGPVITDGSHLDKSTGKLKANVRYESGEHNYISETDQDGRIVYVKARQLKLKKHTGRLKHQGNTPNKKKDDHAGHLIGDSFGGSPELDNLLSQASKVNLGSFKMHENLWRAALQQNKKVKVSMWIQYDAASQSKRPSHYHINYQIEHKFDQFTIANKN